jgi:hypothetical protein
VWNINGLRDLAQKASQASQSVPNEILGRSKCGISMGYREAFKSVPNNANEKRPSVPPT